MFSAALAALGLLTPTAQNNAADIRKAQLAFADELKTYIKTSPKLGAQEAANQWLRLLDDGKKVPWQGGMGTSPRMQQVQFIAIAAFEALPNPDVWPTIEKSLFHRPPSAENDMLLLIFARLRGDDREVLRLCDRIAPKLRSPFSFDATVRYLAIRRGWTLRTHLDAAEGKTKTAIEKQITGFPPLVGQLPDPEVRHILLSMLSEPDRLARINDEPTHKLLLSLLATRLDKLKEAPWDLVWGDDDQDFLIRLVDRFGPPRPNDHLLGGPDAQGTYLAYLLRTGKVAQAKAAWKVERADPYSCNPFTPVDWRDLRKTYGVVSAMLDNSSDSWLWNIYVAAAMASGHAPDAISRIEAKLNVPGVPTPEKRDGLANLVKLHSGQGNFPAYLRDVAALRAIPTKPEESVYSEADLLKAGILFGDQTTIQTGLDRLEKAVDHNPDVVEFYASQGKPAQIEQYVWHRIARMNASQRTYAVGWQDGKDLCRAAYLENDPAKLIDTLNTYPYWPSDDLNGLLDEVRNPGERPNGEPLFYYVAWAFARTGQKPLAIRILERALALHPENVEAFELLNETAGHAATPFYAELLAADAFAPSALIGKADLLRREGRLAEAEKQARQAIHLDPTDSQAPIGHRFDGNRILAKILRAEGKTNQAKASEAKIEAGRLTDRGQALSNIGFYPQASQALQAAIEIDPTDYLSEELLAEALDAQGKTEGDLHHRKAFDLLSANFGPLTWYYYHTAIPYGGGLEEFRNRIENTPAKTAGAYYFKAELEQIDRRPVAAAADYRNAIALDPSYPEALHELLEMGEHSPLTPSEQESVALARATMEPYGYFNSTVDLEMVHDMRPIYRRLLAARKHLQASSSAPLLPLHSAWANTSQDRDVNFFSGRQLMDRDTPVGALVVPIDLAYALEAYGELAEQNHE